MAEEKEMIPETAKKTKGKGRQAESEALKNIIGAYDNLSESDKISFRNKLFDKICKGLSKEDKNAFKDKRDNLIKDIEQAVKKAKQLETVNALSNDDFKQIAKEKMSIDDVEQLLANMKKEAEKNNQ